jgi:hypothetical protein
MLGPSSLLNRLLDKLGDGTTVRQVVAPVRVLV